VCAQTDGGKGGESGGGQFVLATHPRGRGGGKKKPKKTQGKQDKSWKKKGGGQKKPKTKPLRWGVGPFFFDFNLPSFLGEKGVPPQKVVCDVFPNPKKMKEEKRGHPKNVWDFEKKTQKPAPATYKTSPFKPNRREGGGDFE